MIFGELCADGADKRIHNAEDYHGRISGVLNRDFQGEEPPYDEADQDAEKCEKHRVYGELKLCELRRVPHQADAA